MRITAVINQKGGVGKTTTVEALAAGLHRQGLNVLAVDLDPQGNLTYSMQGDGEGPSMFGVIFGEVKATDAVRHTSRGAIIPAGRMLATVEAAIQRGDLGGVGTEYILRDALRPLEGRFDHVIIDTPPSLGTLTVNAMSAADGVVIPCHADPYSIQGVSRLGETLASIRRHSNPGIGIDGILLTRYSPRAVVRRQLAGLAATIAGRLGTQVFGTAIREAVAVTEAQLEGENIFDHAPRSKVADDYRRFVLEWMAAVGIRTAAQEGE